MLSKIVPLKLEQCWDDIGVFYCFDSSFEKKGRQTNKRKKRKRLRRVIRVTNPNCNLEILSELNQAVPDHLTDESQLH